jgi:hypothetical protein
MTRPKGRSMAMNAEHEESDVLTRIRKWHAAGRSESGIGPNAAVIAAGEVHHWWDVNDLLAELNEQRKQ